MNTFSDNLERLLKSKRVTINEVIDTFKEKSFAILFLLLLAIPALPIPTGGVTHIFEIIAMLLSVELVAGRKTVWLPKKWLKKQLPQSLGESALPRFLKIIKWIERRSKPRLSRLQTNRLSLRAIGAVVFIFSAFAFVAPPFSGLDTLPSLGVVVLSLGVILEDSLLSLIGLIIGCAGIGLVIFLGKAVLKLL